VHFKKKDGLLGPGVCNSLAKAIKFPSTNKKESCRTTAKENPDGKPTQRSSLTCWVVQNTTLGEATNGAEYIVKNLGVCIIF